MSNIVFFYFIFFPCYFYFHMELDLTASNLETEILITSCLPEKLLLARAGIKLTKCTACGFLDK